jgi:hypothetical protein
MTSQQLHDAALKVADSQWDEEFPLVSSTESKETFTLWVKDFYTVALQIIILYEARCLS